MSATVGSARGDYIRPGLPPDGLPRYEIVTILFQHRGAAVLAKGERKILALSSTEC